MTSTQPKPTTTDAGIPVESDEHSLKFDLTQAWPHSDYPLGPSPDEMLLGQGVEPGVSAGPS
jgi:hypothetical protein